MRRIIVGALRALSVAALLSAALPHTAYAQTPASTGGQATPQPPAQPQWILITEVTVKPEMVTQFQNFMKNETNPALRKGGLKWRDVWQRTDLAGSPFEYVIATPIDNFAQYDSGGPLGKALGRDGYAAWQAKAGSFVTSVRRHVIRTRPDLSHQGKMTGPPKLAVISSIRVAPGRDQDFVNYIMNDFMPVFRQAGVTYLVGQTVFGGEADEFVTLALRDSLADIDKGPVVVQALGAEGAMKLTQKLPAGAVVRTERSLLRYVPELSIMPAEAMNR